jgi:uncharacterized protein YcfJ
MFKKFAATTLAVTMIATSAMSVSTQAASAKNGRNGALIAGAIIGLAAGAIVANQARQAHGQGYGAPRLQNNRSNGYTYNNRYAAPSLNTNYGYTAPRRCHNEPIRQWNPYRGHTVIVGYERVCF